MFAERSSDAEGEIRDLVLHLIASHHGRCRPLAPPILDPNADCVSFSEISICKEDRFEGAPHQLGSGVVDRFWKLTRNYGWWGLAYLEALLRMADWRASEKENAEVPE
jgi:CRISPR-associated endonuclease/helicase Cas3